VEKRFKRSVSVEPFQKDRFKKIVSKVAFASDIRGWQYTYIASFETLLLKRGSWNASIETLFS